MLSPALSGSTGVQAAATPKILDELARFACAALCVSYSGPSFRGLGCISFNLCGGAPPFACGLQGYNRTLVPHASPSCALYQRVLPRNDTRVSARVPFLLAPPPPRSVTLLPGALRRLFDANVGFLLSFPVDDLLFNFRQRAGRPQPAGAACIGWDCKPDWVEGSLAAQYLMGAGNHLVWEEEPRLRAGLDALLAGIAECAQQLPFVPPELWDIILGFLRYTPHKNPSCL